LPLPPGGPVGPPAQIFGPSGWPWFWDPSIRAILYKMFSTTYPNVFGLYKFS
ncbi:hypothetical protein L9F63_025703, partial [Diploptera punctata]